MGNPRWPHRQVEFGPAIRMSLMVAIRTHVRVCGTQVQKTKPVIDMNLSEASITAQTEVQARLLSTEPYSAKLPEGDGIVFVEDMIFAFLKVRRPFQPLSCIWGQPDNQLKLLVAGLPNILALDVDQVLYHSKGFAQFLSISAGEQRMQQSVSYGHKRGAL